MKMNLIFCNLLQQDWLKKFSFYSDLLPTIKLKFTPEEAKSNLSNLHLLG